MTVPSNMKGQHLQSGLSQVPMPENDTGLGLFGVNDLVQNIVDLAPVEKKVPEKTEPRDLDAEQETEAYTMLSQLFEYDPLCEAEEFGLKRTKNTLYKGIIVDRKRQGLGVLIY